jgi:hypothetical protein
MADFLLFAHLGRLLLPVFGSKTHQGLFLKWSLIAEANFSIARITLMPM